MDDSPTTASPISPPKARRTWRRRLALALAFLVMAAAGGLLLFFWSASSELDAMIAELDRVDPGWRLESIAVQHKAVPDADNSALQSLAISGGGGWMWEMDKLFNNLPPQVELNE